MDKTTYTIGVLAIIAALLILANVIVQPPQAQAAEVASMRDWSMITARFQQGGEILYVVDNRSGLMAVFQWDNVRKGMVLKDAGHISDAFAERR
jgi:hypothetical protein